MDKTGNIILGMIWEAYDNLEYDTPITAQEALGELAQDIKKFIDEAR